MVLYTSSLPFFSHRNERKVVCPMTRRYFTKESNSTQMQIKIITLAVASDVFGKRNNRNITAYSTTVDSFPNRWELLSTLRTI